MNLELFEFDKLPDQNKLLVTQLISDYTHGKLGEKPQMLPVEPSDVLAKNSAYVAIHAAAEAFNSPATFTNNFAGFIGANKAELWQGKLMSEVGSLWVPKHYRGLGIAHGLVAICIESVSSRGEQPYTFVNHKSKPIFKDNGFDIADGSAVPESALEACSACPMKPPQGCCDDIMIYGGTK